MSARKSLPGWLSRYSHISTKSQESGVLNSDSEVISDDEANPLWYKDFENHTIRPSARFSLARTDSPVLNSDSEPDTTPLQRSWWKNVPNTPFQEPRGSNASRERSDTQEKSIVESSDVSSVDERVRKPRFVARRNKRKSVGTSKFLKILDQSEDSVSSEKGDRGKTNSEKQDLISTPSESDVSIEKVRKQPFKPKKTRQVRSFHVDSDDSQPEEFQDALDGSQPPEQTQSQATAGNKSASFRENRETSLLSSSKNVGQRAEDSSPVKLRAVGNTSREDLIGDNELEESVSPVLTSRAKIRSKFTATTKRKTPDFDEILNNASKDESSIRRESNVDRNQRSEESFTRESDFPTHILAREDVSDSEESITRQRVPFAYKKRKNRQEKSFTQLMESPNTSIRSEPIKTPGKQTAELDHSKQEIPWSDVERRSLKRRSNVAAENQVTKKLSRSLSNANKSGVERRSTNEKIDQAETSRHSNIELEDNGNKSGVGNRSISKKNEKSGEVSYYSDVELEDDESVSIERQPSGVGNESGAETLSKSKKNDSAEISSHSDVESEDDQSVSIRASSSSVGNKSGTERRSTNEKNDRVGIPGPSLVELQEDQAVSIPIRPSSGRNKSTAGRQSVNKTKDNAEHLSSLNMELEDEPIVFKKPSRTSKSVSNRNKTLSNDSQLNESRSSTQAKDTSRGIQNISSNNELLASNNEEEDEENNFTNVEDLPDNRSGINQTQKNKRFSNDSRSQLRESSTANMQTTAQIHLANETPTQKKTPSSKKLESTTSQNPEKEFPPLPESISDSTGENSRLLAADCVEDNANRRELSFSSVDPIRPGSAQAGPTQSLDVAELSQLKIALEEVKQKMRASRENPKIDSYFQSVRPTKPSAAAVRDTQRVTKTIKPVGKQKKTESKSPNKAYLVNGKVYKRPPLVRPKSWATNRLYQYLWKKMEPKYKLKTRVRSEKFVVDLSNVVALVVRRKKYENYVGEVEKLIHEMARLGIIETRNDFHIFCRDFLPYDFRIKVIPMFLPGSVRNIPFEPEKLHTPILESNLE